MGSLMHAGYLGHGCLEDWNSLAEIMEKSEGRTLKSMGACFHGPKVGPKSAQRRLRVGSKLAQSRLKVKPVFAQNGPK